MDRDRNYVINGSFLLEPALGVQRYAVQITKQLDSLLSKKEGKLHLEIVVPDTEKSLADLQKKYANIKIVSYGRHTGRLWEQLDFPRYLRKRKTKGISLCNTVPLFAKGGIVCVHDIVFQTHPEFFTEPGDWHEILFRKLMYRHAFKTADQIITVSNFSKNEILNNYRLKNPDICVAGNAWQHYDRTDIDETIFEENPQIGKQEYYYYLASLAPNKNLKWILENAKNNPQQLYVLSGKPLGDNSGVEQLSNILCTGYVTDARARALMKHCKAFLFPSTYEGFGIPPMEALCMGAKIVLGDIPSLREIYKDTAYYVDCENPYCDIDKLLAAKQVKPAETVLSRYSWQKSAEKIAEVLTKQC